MELPRSSPGEIDDLRDALEDLLQPALIERNINQISWWVADAYFRGIREFYVVDYERGQLEVGYEDDDGELHLRWDEAMTKFQTEVGRLAKIDTSPMVDKHSFSLDSLKMASTAQVLLSEIMSPHAPEMMKMRFLTGLVEYGTYGIACWPDDLFDGPLGYDHEIIPPWELLGVPSAVSNHSELRGICRTRLFDLNELKKKPGVKMPEDEALLEIEELPYGAAVGWSDSRYPWAGNQAHSGTVGSLFDRADSEVQRARRAKGERGQEQARGPLKKFVKLREWYLTGPQGTVSRTIWQAGRAVVFDKTYFEGKNKEKVPFPIGIARYDDIGRFYGRSWASKVIPLVMELESLLERLITNVKDMDRFGYIMIPTSSGINFEEFKDTGDDPRIITYEPDYAVPGAKVESIQPVSASDIPGRTMQFGTSLLDRMVSQGPAFAGNAPGRIDSGEGLDILAETGGTHLMPKAESINAAYTTMYRYILWTLSKRVRKDLSAEGVAVNVSRIENTMAGIEFDPQTGQMKMRAESIPDPWKVKLSIRSKNPATGERRRQEAILMMQQGILLPLEFIILNYQENWNFPIGNRAVYENYVRAVLLNLVMFNDGRQLGTPPGGVYFLEHADKPEVHLHAVQEFIAGPQFGLSAQPIQDAFHERVNTLKTAMGQVVPPALGGIEDAAVRAEGQDQAVQQRQSQIAALLQAGPDPRTGGGPGGGGGGLGLGGGPGGPNGGP